MSKLIWIGSEKGVEGLPNIPGRDLSADEVKQYGGEKALLDTGLYEKSASSKPQIKEGE